MSAMDTLGNGPQHNVETEGKTCGLKVVYFVKQQRPVFGSLSNMHNAAIKTETLREVIGRLRKCMNMSLYLYCSDDPHTRYILKRLGRYLRGEKRNNSSPRCFQDIVDSTSLFSSIEVGLTQYGDILLQESIKKETWTTKVLDML